MNIDQQTLEDLEFTTIQTWLQAFAIGPTAHELLGNLTPIKNNSETLAELRKVKELKDIRTEGETFPRLEFEELLEEIRLLPIKNASIQLEGFMRIHLASTTVNQLLYFFNKRESEYPLLCSILGEAYFTKDIIEAIERVFDRHGKVKDDASEALFEIRSKIGSVRKQINRNFDKEMRKLIKDNVLGDTRETFISDRRVLTVLSNYKRKISGTVHGSSNTGNLTYIEPQVNIPLNNELELLLDDERKEIFKILQALKSEILDHISLIIEYQRILTSFDFINAKCKLALDLNCNMPSIMPELEMELIDAFHPILWKNNKDQKKKTLPQHVRMDKFSRMLVISGPNAGGKSITLKSIGLLQLMIQSGLLVPVHPNSKMCLFENVLSDIGDNQSITNELSTYSYRLKRMRQFLEIANKNTLLLLDEFGTGSDPDLGGALAEVIFEALYNKKSYAVITTHYNNIKLKADRLKNAVNGSMLFNTETLEPTYLFSTGQPGSSFTFEVAQINGIPEDLIEEAKNRLDDKKVQMDRLLNELQKEKNYLSRLNQEHIEAQDIASKALIEYEEKRALYEAKLKSFRENAEVNQKLVQHGKKLTTYIDKYNINTRKKSINDSLVDEIKKYIAVEKSKLVEAKNIAKAKKISPKSKKKGKAKKEDDIYNRDKIVIGSRVKLIATKQVGSVEEINGKDVTVAFGFIRMKVDLNKLMWVD
ncbi:MAG: DNA mismatch repair protein MutS [Crocinitomicaceae bacterium]|nr:DNA mismatch repair protein MutS [Crocinitomicaceae bacterium]